jgi:hypothetical protein
LCITMWTDAPVDAKRRGNARSCVALIVFSPVPRSRVRPPAAIHSAPALNMVAVTRLRPECLLR